MGQSYEKLITLLKKILLLNPADLDFDLYRVMNFRKKEIDKFLCDELHQQIQAEVEQCGEVYSCLIDFFSRFYCNGNFHPLSHVPGSDQYYVKTIEKQLKGHASRNAFDYFIHKDLGGFLRRELDFFLKNEVMFPGGLDSVSEIKIDKAVSKARIVRKAAYKIIALLEQLENFQKTLWLKKKFVMQADYCITLDRVPEELYPEINGNTRQIEEWKKLFSIQEMAGYVEPLPVEFLKDNPFLVLDTALFDRGLKEKIISSLDNADEEISGLLVYSDNFQALNFLSEKYEGSIDCIYIDPPYNTGLDKFVYKDNYQRSSWIAMMTDRIHLGRKLLSEKGAFFVSINNKEIDALKHILSEQFVLDAVFNIKVRHEERLLRADTRYQDVMEYLLLAAKSEAFNPTRIRVQREENVQADYVYKIVVKNSPKEVLWLGSREVELYDRNGYDIIKSEPEDRSYKRYTIRGSLITQSGSASEFYEMYLRGRREKDGCGALYKVIGMGVKGDGLGYRYIMQPEADGGDNGIYFQGRPLKRKPKSLPHPNFFDFVNEFNNCRDEGGIKFQNGKKPLALLNKVFEIAGIGNNPGAVVMDFFAGSGTTGHAVINLNREDKGRRKYILVEKGEYFDTVLKPRIQKAIYSKGWKGGKPVSREGTSHIFKYIRLESYEDALNNMEFEKDESLQSKARIFSDPFSYKLKTVKGMENKETAVDLVETFNYLIGLAVKRIGATESFNAMREVRGNAPAALKLSAVRYDEGEYAFKGIEGCTASGKKVLVIWRKMTGNTVKDNEALAAYLMKKGMDPQQFDLIYANGYDCPQDLSAGGREWKVIPTEEEFKRRMFG